jgi:Dyp-type peroxidase family
MAVNLNNPKPIDQNDLKFDSLLSNLQGNILKGHGRDYTANIFVEFDATKLSEVREWIHNFAAKCVTSAKVQLKENERFKRNGVPGGLFAGLYVTAKGYEYFQVPSGKRPSDSSFRNGMEAAALNDPPRSQWEPTFRGLNIHVMVLLGDDDKTTLSVAAAKIIGELRPLTSNDPFVSSAIRTEYGNAIRNANGDGLEHFGYVDGVSQPLFFKDENDRFKANATPSTGSTLAWDPFAPLKLVLVKDPSVTTVDACGSYFVFRKLEQDVRAFKVAEQDIATALNLSGEDRELAGALVVGRFEDGTPVTLTPRDGLIGSGAANNFNYDRDKAGLRCPFQGHIRKSNPRGTGGAEPLAGEKAHIMARRGIPFGLREVTPAIESQPEQFPSGGGVGLLFQSFQADLGAQFEFIQKAWVNNASFPFSNPAGHTGVDPIIGQGGTPADRNYAWPAAYDQPGAPVTASFGSFVTMKGGQYFFAPSIDGLKAL